MKKHQSVLIIILSILFVSCNSRSESTIIERKGYTRSEELVGDIASVTISHYALSTKFGEEEIGDLKIEETFIFNAAGNVVEQITYNPIGNPGYKYSTVKRIYNEQEQLIKKIEYSEDTTFNYKTRYKYNSFGKLSEKRYYTCYSDNDDYHELLSSVTKPLYDNTGKLSEVSSYNSSGELRSKELRTYDNDEYLIERSIYNSKGDLDKKYTFNYDRKGNRIEQCKYDSDELLVERAYITYKDNRPVEMHVYSRDQLIRRVVSKYENGKNIEEINYLANGDIEYLFVCIYDEMGNMTQQKLYEGNIKQPSELTTWNIEYR